jgi:hypothetical protein
MNRKKKEFPNPIKRKIVKRSNNRCERCNIDFDDDFKGEFHHIIPVVFGGTYEYNNCSLLCKKCHNIAPNIKNENELIFYYKYFLRFASFKEASEYYEVNTRAELYVKFAIDIYNEIDHDSELIKKYLQC